MVVQPTGSTLSATTFQFAISSSVLNLALASMSSGRLRARRTTTATRTSPPGKIDEDNAQNSQRERRPPWSSRMSTLIRAVPPVVLREVEEHEVDGLDVEGLPDQERAPGGSASPR